MKEYRKFSVVSPAYDLSVVRMSNVFAVLSKFVVKAKSAVTSAHRPGVISH